MFKFKKTKEESPTKNYNKYDIFDDADTLIALENEIKPFGDLYHLCQAKGWIHIIEREGEVTLDFTVNPETAAYFTDYCQKEKALSKRIAYFKRKQEEADKQMLL